MKTELRSTAIGAAFAALVSIITPTAASAQGALDFLDPCVAAGHEVNAQRSELEARLRTAIAQSDQQTTPSAEFAKEWWLIKQRALRDHFVKEARKQRADITREELDAAFKPWLKNVIAAAGGWPTLNRYIEEDWDRLRKADIADAQQRVAAASDEMKRQYEDACKPDVANQALHVAVPLAMMPVTIASRNLEIAKRESGAVDQLLAGTTGISIKSIKEEGPLGGKHSVPNEVIDFGKRTLGIKW